MDAKGVYLNQISKNFISNLEMIKKLIKLEDKGLNVLHLGIFY